MYALKKSKHLSRLSLTSQGLGPCHSVPPSTGRELEGDEEGQLCAGLLHMQPSIGLVEGREAAGSWPNVLCECQAFTADCLHQDADQQQVYFTLLLAMLQNILLSSLTHANAKVCKQCSACCCRKAEVLWALECLKMVHFWQKPKQE
jgi:hypothetical protein